MIARSSTSRGFSAFFPHPASLRNALRSICFAILPIAALAVPIRAQPAAAPSTVIRIGIEQGNSPLSHADENGQPRGFLVDLVDTIAKERNLQISYKYLPWGQLLSEFKAGKIDVVANMVFTAERDAYADFSIAHLVLPGAVYLRKGDTSIRTADDLRFKRLAAVPGGYSYDTAVKHGWGKEILAATSLSDALEMLDAAKVDAVLGTKIFAEFSIRENNLSHIEAAPFAVSDLRFQYHLAVLKGQDSLLYELNAGLIAIRNNGTYDDIYEKWIGPLEPRILHWRDLRPYLLPSLVILLALSFAFWRQRRLVKKLRQQTQALETSEERLTLVLEGSQDAFWDWDVTTNHVTRGERWAIMLGATPEQLGTGIESLEVRIHPDDLAHVQQARELLTQQGHGRVEYRVRGRNNQWIWILDRGKVVARDAEGNPTRMTGAASDITVQKRIEEALGRSQALLEQSQRAAEIGGWEYDAANGTLYWTLQAFRIHDLDPDAGTPDLERLFSFYKPDAQPAIRNAFKAAIDKGVSFDLELELLTANKRSVWIRTIGRAEQNTTKVVRVYGSFQDITFRKKAEDDRQKLQTKMQEAQKLESLGVLAGGIAHDFNNLLTVIMGNASIAREDPTSATESLQQIETATQRAADLCRQMLAYAGKSRTSMGAVDLNAIVTDTVHLIRLSISKNATLDFALDPDPLPIEADHSQIRQVVMNLVINASDSLGDASGRIRVSTTRQIFTTENLRDARLGQELPPGEYMVFEVQDEGCGMSEETLTRIFDPFFTTKFTGRGLGLAAVLGIVRAHQGAFFVHSTLGHGATFRMLLPTTTKPLAANRTNVPTATANLLKSGSFLVVDDEPHVRRLACTVLERAGHKVALASDGYEALALLLAHGGQFNAILLDLTMPGMDGPTTLKELRQMKIHVPVLIMSGFSEFDARKRFADDPMIDFLPKPFTGEILLTSLNNLLDRAKNAKTITSPPTPNAP